MGYRAKYYDKKTKTEKAWHNSSMIKYTEMVEDPNENWGTLTVVFNNGSTYRYKKVSLSDYVYTVAGGIDASNGKTFNKMIKERGYEYEKIEPLTQEYIDRGLEELENKQEAKYYTWFVSGPEDFTDEEFDVWIAEKLINAINETQGDGNNEARFILQDTPKFGKQVQDYLIDVLGVEPENITICKLNGTDTSYSKDGVRVYDGCETEEELDEYMTTWSAFDIDIIRNWGTELTRQSKNILRRYIYE